MIFGYLQTCPFSLPMSCVKETSNEDCSNIKNLKKLQSILCKLNVMKNWEILQKNKRIWFKIQKSTNMAKDNFLMKDPSAPWPKCSPGVQMIEKYCHIFEDSVIFGRNCTCVEMISIWESFNLSQDRDS